MNQTATAPRLDPAAAERFVRFRLRHLWLRRFVGLLADRFGVALLLAGTALLLVGIYRFLRGGEPFSPDGRLELAGSRRGRHADRHGSARCRGART